MHVDVLEHPVVAAQLTEIRDAATDRRRFRQLLHQVARALVFEAARTIPTMPVTVESPMGPADGVELVAQPVLIPILRAGLGMLDAGLEALPGSETGTRPRPRTPTSRARRLKRACYRSQLGLEGRKEGACPQHPLPTHIEL